MEVWQDEHKFQVMLDVSPYKLEEIRIEAFSTEIIIHASHEERSDKHGYITRSFRRRIELPEGVRSDSITSYLTPEGFLSIVALKGLAEASQERVVPIRPAKQVHWSGDPSHDLQRVQVIPEHLPTYKTSREA